MLERKHYIIIAVVVVVIIAFCGIWWWTKKKNESETFLSPEVMVADGHCKSRHESMANYYMTPYPYYPKEGYFKPLPENKTENTKIDFEKTNYTPLYTNKI